MGHALAWDSWIGEKGDPRPTPPTPPIVIPETDKRRVRDSRLVNIISLLLTSSMDVLNEVERVLVKGCDQV